MLIFQESDESLMDWVCLDQAGAFEELVRRYENRFLATAYRSLGNRATAEDIVQDTFTALWEQRRRFDKKIAKFSTWAYSILQNKITMYLRDSRKDRAMVSLAAVAEDKDDLVVPTQRHWLDDLPEAKLHKLREIVLKYLTKPEQELYRLKDEEGLSYEAISRLPAFKGVKVTTLKKRRQRYKDKIIEVFEESEMEAKGGYKI
jgi:RNA polymerase sigma-70 factor (ECF subfamily)